MGCGTWAWAWHACCWLHYSRRRPSDKDDKDVSMLLIALLANDDGVDIRKDNDDDDDEQQQSQQEGEEGAGTGRGGCGKTSTTWGTKLFDYNAVHYGLKSR